MAVRWVGAVFCVAMIGMGMSGACRRNKHRTEHEARDASTELPDPTAECRLVCDVLRERGCSQERIDTCMLGCLVGELTQDQCVETYRAVIVCTASIDVSCGIDGLDPGLCTDEMARHCECRGPECDAGTN